MDRISDEELDTSGCWLHTSLLEWWRGETGLMVVAEPVALAADGDRRRPVEEPVQQRGGERRVGEDLIPLAKALVTGGHDRLLLLVPLVHRSKKHVASALSSGR